MCVILGLDGTFVDTLTVPAAATRVVERMKVRRRAMKISQQELYED